VRRSAKSSIRKRKRPASPGQPPSSHTGLTGDRSASGTEGPLGDFSITNFSRNEPLEEGVTVAGSPNRTGISVGPISGISKKGWEYLWVRYADAEDTGSNTLVKQPVAAYVEKVYEDGNFAALGIGT